MTLTTCSPEATEAVGEKLGAACRGGEVILLSGDLGTGKTRLTKGIARGLGIDSGQVTSPTFTLMAIHHGRLPLYHVDLYRIDDAEEIAHLGLFEQVEGPGVIVIEWPEQGDPHVPPAGLTLHLTQGKSDAERKLSAQAGDAPHLLAALS